MYLFSRSLITIIIVLCIFQFCNAVTVKDEGLIQPIELSDISELLPDWIDGEFYLSSTDHFLVAHDADPAQAQDLAIRLENALGHFLLFFNQSGFEIRIPQNKLNWISFSNPAHFAQYAIRTENMDLSALGGYYSARTNRVVIIESNAASNTVHESVFQAQTYRETSEEISAITGDHDPNQFMKMAHELAHQLAFNTGLQKRGVMYPLWVSEGLATQYETRLSCFRKTNIARSRRLMEMKMHNRLIPLDQFIHITRLPAEQYLCEDLYAQAWHLFAFLLQHHPEQLRNYLKQLYNENTGFRTVEKIQSEFIDNFGPMDQLNVQWIRSINHQ